MTTIYTAKQYKYILPKLPFSYDAFEPYIDAQTMETHYTKHHQAYVDNLNAFIEKHDELKTKTLQVLLTSIDLLPEGSRQVIINNAGGHASHSLFWEILGKDNTNLLPRSKLLDAIKKEFGDFENFKKLFSEAALKRFGSGWVWLTVDNTSHQLAITSTANQDSPLSVNKTPILCLDVWEHAYYLKYQNRRKDYIEAFWQVIYWPKVEELYLETLANQSNYID